MAYLASPIQYYRVNLNNDSIASSPGGNSSTPTEEITEPTITSGTFSLYTPSPTPTITGSTTPQATTFETDFYEGQYLYFIDNNGNFVLVGQIASIVSQTSLTLTAAASTTPSASSQLAASYALITNQESIYVRIPGQSVGTNQYKIPDFSAWRLGNNLNNTSIAGLQQMSVAGTPLQNYGPPALNIPFTFVTMNIFNSTATNPQGVPTYFSSNSAFPVFIWIKVTPKIGATTSLASNTLYRFTITETQPDVLLDLNTPKTTLTAAGYNIA